jgi:hypothetical protein
MTGSDPERAGPAAARVDRQVEAFLGVYHADGGLLGELRYVVGKLLGTTHCALCDVTHSAVRRKREWDAMVGSLGVEFELLHLNEMPPDVARSVAASGSPVVLARVVGGGLQTLLGPGELDRLGASVDRFRAALVAAVTEHGLRLPEGPDPARDPG